MNVIFILLPLSLLLAIAGVLGFIWAVRRGQYDDVETPALRALSDDVRESQSNVES
ncbi:MAG: cbb3-type cytochrome oxidase assembly protein CcoS [Bdellovibrionales bacterium]|nr:cbb3-type cytochrome oxidase assembly protein CcoS [Bdellovibrionales bacterium]